MNNGPGATPGLLFSAAAERNQAAIDATLSSWVPGAASFLELASGSGQHAQYLCVGHPHWTWQPTDADARVLPAIAARCAGVPGVQAPIQLDVAALSWPVPQAHYDAVYCANLLHISAPTHVGALMRGAACHLRPGAGLFVYGPFFEAGRPTAPGNLAFDADLRSRHPAWGLRTLDDVQRTALEHGLVLEIRQPMPANNLMLWFRRLP